MRRTPVLVVVFVLGIGMIAAPAVFRMFSRAPAGGDMIDDFEPYMTSAEIEKFRGYLDLIGAADAQAHDEVLPALVDAGEVDSGEIGTRFSSVEALHAQWPGIDEDMSDLLSTMDENLGNFDSVASLPSFDLFPWFFVAPGAVVALAAATALRRGRHGQHARLATLVLLVAGLGIALAPAVFQMFTRAPDGAAMIDDFRPMMTQERVTRVQGYFVTMGAAEGELRNEVLPAADDLDAPADDVTAFSERWPTIVGELAPMVATMSDNVDNFAAVDALPSFDLFPWFFVVPGLLVAGLTVAAVRSARPSSERNPS